MNLPTRSPSNSAPSLFSHELSDDEKVVLTPPKAISFRSSKNDFLCPPHLVCEKPKDSVKEELSRARREDRHPGSLTLRRENRSLQTELNPPSSSPPSSALALYRNRYLRSPQAHTAGTAGTAEGHRSSSNLQSPSSRTVLCRHLRLDESRNIPSSSTRVTKTVEKIRVGSRLRRSVSSPLHPLPDDNSHNSMASFTETGEDRRTKLKATKSVSSCPNGMTSYRSRYMRSEDASAESRRRRPSSHLRARSSSSSRDLSSSPNNKPTKIRPRLRRSFSSVDATLLHVSSSASFSEDRRARANSTKSFSSCSAFVSTSKNRGLTSLANGMRASSEPLLSCLSSASSVSSIATSASADTALVNNTGGSSIRQSRKKVIKVPGIRLSEFSSITFALSDDEDDEDNDSTTAIDHSNSKISNNDVSTFASIVTKIAHRVQSAPLSDEIS